MPWEVPITVDGLEYPVRFNTEEEPSKADIDEAVQQILSQPKDSSQGYATSALSSVGRGLASSVIAPIGGAGYLLPDALGGQALVDVADSMEEGVRGALPINPIYEDTFGMKAFNAVGQAGGMIATGGVGGLTGKALGAGSKLAIRKGAERAALGSGFLAGAQEGGRSNERYGIDGVSAWLNALGHGGTEVLTEKYLFGLGTETAAARRLLGERLNRGAGAFTKDVLTEGGEEVASNTLGNALNKAFAPEGVVTPDVLAGNLEAGALGMVGGGVFAGVNALTGAYDKDKAAVEAEFPSSAPQDISDADSMRNFRAGGSPIIASDGSVKYAPPPTPAESVLGAVEAVEATPAVVLADNAVEGLETLNPGSPTAAVLAEQTDEFVQTAATTPPNERDTTTPAAAEAETNVAPEPTSVEGQTALPSGEPPVAPAIETAEEVAPPIAPDEPAGLGQGVSASDLSGSGPVEEAAAVVATGADVDLEQQGVLPVARDQADEQEAAARLADESLAGGVQPQDGTVVAPTTEDSSTVVLTPQQAMLKQAAAVANQEQPANVSAAVKKVIPDRVETVAQRDVTKPEQMTPEEFDGNDLATAKYVEEMGKLDAKGINPPPREFMLKAATTVAHKESLNRAVVSQQPVSAAAVDAYGIKLPEGYTRQGELYVFDPKNTPTTPISETASDDGEVKSTGPRASEGSISPVAAASSLTNENASSADSVVAAKMEKLRAYNAERKVTYPEPVYERIEQFYRTGDDSALSKYDKKAIEGAELPPANEDNAKARDARIEQARKDAAAEAARKAEDQKVYDRLRDKGVLSVAEPPTYELTQEKNAALAKKAGLPTEQGVYVDAEKTIKSSLAKIANNSNLSWMTRAVARVLQRISFKGVDLRIEADGRRNFAGYYLNDDGITEIGLNMRQVARGQVDVIGTFLHELLHHATLAKVRDPQNAVENEAVALLAKIVQRVRSLAGLAENGRFKYETSNVEEFISALFTRPDFQAFLSTLPMEDAPKTAAGKFRSVLSEIFRVIAKLVSGKEVARGSTLEQAMTASLALFETPQRTIETGTLDSRAEALDVEYMQAVREGDVAKQQAMVESPANSQVNSVRATVSNLLGLTGKQLVDSDVLTAIGDSKILDPIISSIPVDVVNNFGGKKRASEMLFHYLTVPADPLRVGEPNDLVVLIPAAISADSARSTIAGVRAELSSSNPRLHNGEMFTALDTLQDRLIQLLDRDGAAGSMTGAGTKAAGSRLVNVGGDLEGFATVGADFIHGASNKAATATSQGRQGNDPLPKVSTAEEDAKWLARNPKSAAKLAALVDAAAKAAGYDKLLHHGTRESTYTPGEWIGGDNSGIPKLKKLAEKFGLKSYGDVANILERWKEYGMLEQQGATVEEAENARKWYDASKSTHQTRGTHALNFNVFEMPSGDQELGTHLGTVEQALNFGEYAHPFFINLGNEIRTKDLGTWNYQAVMMALRKKGVKVSDSDYDAVFNARDNNQALRDLLISKGVNSIVYNNEAEARGDSHIVLSPNQIKSADPITRDAEGNVIPLSERFNQATPDIRFSIAETYDDRKTEDINSPAYESRKAASAALRSSDGKITSVGVSSADGINAVTALQGVVPGIERAWTGTRADFIADEALGKAYPGVLTKLTGTGGDQLEGAFMAGRAFLFTDQVGVYEADERMAKREGITPQEASAQRVLVHEALVHRGFYALSNDERRALFNLGMRLFFADEMDALAQQRGFERDWRYDVPTREHLMEELIAKKIERLKSPPKSGPLKELWDILVSIWKRITGQTTEPTLANIHDMARMLRTALVLAEGRTETRDGRPIEVQASRRPVFTNPLDSTLSQTAQRIREMRDGPATNAVDLTQAYRNAVLGKSSAMVSLDDLYAAAKALNPSLTEKQFGAQVQALYDDNGAYVEPAESPAVMQAAADKYNVRSSQGIPANYVMIVEPVMASFREPGADPLPKADGERLKDRINNVRTAGKDKDSEQAEIVNTPNWKYTEQGINARVDAAVDIVDALYDAGATNENVVNYINDPDLHKQLDMQQDADMLKLLYLEAMARGAKAGVEAYQDAASKGGRTLGSGALLHTHPRYAHLFLMAGMTKEMNDQHQDVTEANLGTGTTETVKKADDEARPEASDETTTVAEDEAMRLGEESLSEKAKRLLAKIRDEILDIGIIRTLLAKNKGDVKASLSASQMAELVAKFQGKVEGDLQSILADKVKNVERMLGELAGEIFTTDKAKGKKTTKDEAAKKADALSKLDKRKKSILSDADAKTFTRIMEKARDGVAWRKIFSDSPQNQDDKAKAMLEAMQNDPALADLSDPEKAQLADIFAKQWAKKRQDLLAAKVSAILKRKLAKHQATQKGVEAAKEKIPAFIQAINRGELTDEFLAAEIAEKFGYEKLTDAERAQIEKLSKELQAADLPVHVRVEKVDALVKIIATKTRMSAAEILSAFWVASVLSGPRTAFTIGLAVLSGGFEVYGHAAAGILRTIGTSRRNEGLAAAMDAITNHLKAFPRSVRMGWEYVKTGDKRLLALADPSQAAYFDTGKLMPVSVGQRLAENGKNPASRMIGRFMWFMERLLTSLDMVNSTMTRHGMLPISYLLNQKNYDRAKVGSLLDFANYRKKALELYHGDVEPTTGPEKALLTRQAENLMETELKKYGNLLDDANYGAGQAAMTLHPEGLGGVLYDWIRSTSNLATRGAEKLRKEANKLNTDGFSEDENVINKKFRQGLAILAELAAHQLLNLTGVRFARFGSNKLNQSLSFIPVIGLARLAEKTYAGQVKNQSLIRNQGIGIALAVLGYSLLKAIEDEPDDEKRGWAIEGSWGGLTPDQKSQAMSAGKKPYTITWNGKVFNYANWPISSVLAAIGIMSDRIRYAPDKWKETTAIGKIGTGVLASILATKDSAALSQLSEIFGGSVYSRDPVDSSLNQMSRVFGNWAGGLVPRFAKDIDLMLDGEINKYEGMGHLLKEIPVYRRYVGEPRLDIFAQPVEVSRTPWSREFQQEPEEREYRLLGQFASNDLWLTPANADNRRVGRGKRSREMTDAEKGRYITLVGEGYRKTVLRYGDRLVNMTPENAKDLLGKLTAKVRDNAERMAVRTAP